jgi:hypothetical protein
MGADAEDVAERIVIRDLGGLVVGRDDQSLPGMVDLIIEAADQRRVAVEVTTLTPGDAAAFEKASAKFGGPNNVLSRVWRVQFLRGTRIKKVTAGVVALLRDLEAAGVTGLDRNAPAPGEQTFLDRLRTLGVVRVASGEGPGWILVVDRHIGSGDASGEILAEVAIDTLNDPNRQDNAGKLMATGLDHRHLFIVVSPHADHVHVAV